jgi:hypothetical protein
MPNRVTKLIRDIQNSDEERKRRWLFGLSAFTMLIVITLWLGYLNLTILNVPGGSSEAAAENPTDERSFTSAMKRGSAIVYHQIVSFFERQSQATNDFEIKGDGHFQIYNLPSITPREIK